MPPFQIPNQQSYFPALPPRPDDTDTSQADEQVYPAQRLDLSPEENQQMLMRAFMERINAQPPAPPPPVTLSPKQRFGLGMMSGPLQQIMLKRLMEQQPGYQDYAQKEAGFQAGQKQLGDIGQMLGTMQRTGQSADRMEMYRYVPGKLDYLHPTKGNVTLPVTFDRFTHQYIDMASGQPVQLPEGGLNMPIHFTPYTTTGGDVGSYPTSPQPQATPQIPTVAPPTVRPSSSGTGHMPGSPSVTGVPGGQAQNMKPLPPKQAPSALTEQATRQSKFLGGLEGVMSAWDEANQAQIKRFGTSAPGLIGQMAQDYTSQGRYGRAFVSHYGDPQVAAYYNKIRLALYDYVKAQTGAQFSITEMDRYLASFPTTVDDPQTAHDLIRQHADRAVREINTLKLNWKSIQVGNQRIYVSPDYLEEFLAGGGTVGSGSQEVQPTDPAEAILQKHLEKKRAGG